MTRAVTARDTKMTTATKTIPQQITEAIDAMEALGVDRYDSAQLIANAATVEAEFAGERTGDEAGLADVAVTIEFGGISHRDEVCLTRQAWNERDGQEYWVAGGVSREAWLGYELAGIVDALGDGGGGLLAGSEELMGKIECTAREAIRHREVE